MYSIMLRHGLFYLSLLLTAAGCIRTDELTVAYEELARTGEGYELHDVVTTDAGYIVAVGGLSFFDGVVMIYRDGQSVVQRVTDKQLLAATVLPSGEVVATGVSGRFCRLMPEASSSFDVALGQLFYWDKMTGIAYYADDDAYLMSSGIAYKDGRHYRYTTDLAVQSADSIVQEVSDIVLSESGVAHSVGYGTVLRSTNGGYTWRRADDIPGDFYQSVDFPTAQVGYTVGLSGSILTTTDGGDTWQTLRNGDRISNRNLPFRAVDFADAARGMAVGDDGLLWYTADSGDTWAQLYATATASAIAIYPLEP